ncbi:MAG: hypothetical protein WCK11_04230 [Candidatus Falkowbacteria bacterium]
MKKNVKNLLAFCILSVVIFGVISVQNSFAAPDDAKTLIRGGLNTAAENTGLKEQGKVDLPVKIGEVLGQVLSYIGLIFLGLVIYGGMLWMTAGGNEEKVKKSISLMIQAIVGLIIVSSAYIIVKTVGDLLITPNAK